MAIGIGSIVAVKITSVVGGSALAAGAVSGQPPCFGISESAATPFTVTWANNGSRVASIPITSLDEITDADTATLALRGQVVSVIGYSPTYNSVVVSAHQRNDVNYVLLKSINTDAFWEVLASTVAVVEGQ